MSYVDPSGAESEAEEAEEKIRGSRNPARGREEERGSSLNTTVGGAARNNQQNRFPLDGEEDGEQRVDGRETCGRAKVKE